MKQGKIKPEPLDVFVTFNSSSLNPALLLKRVKASQATFCSQLGDSKVVISDHRLTRRELGDRSLIFVMTDGRRPPKGAILVPGRNWDRRVAGTIRTLAKQKAQLAVRSAVVRGEWSPQHIRSAPGNP